MLKPVVFVLDDHIAVRRSFVVLFESAGLESHGLCSVHDFLSAYDKSRGGCLVVDAELPDMNGLALQTHLREHDIHLPIIFVTGHGDIATAVQAIRGGPSTSWRNPSLTTCCCNASTGRSLTMRRPGGTKTSARRC